MFHRNYRHWWSKDWIQKYLDNKLFVQRLLNSRYCDIFEYRIGLKDGKRHTQMETGNTFSISNVRVHQIEQRILEELIQRRWEKLGWNNNDINVLNLETFSI